MVNSGRKRLHQRRSHEVIAIEHDGQRYKIGIGREIVCIERGVFGPVVEVFLNAQKVNSPVDCLACDGAILISMLLQYGCAAAEIAKAIKRNPNGSPSSLFGHVANLIVEAA